MAFRFDLGDWNRKGLFITNRLTKVMIDFPEGLIKLWVFSASMSTFAVFLFGVASSWLEVVVPTVAPNFFITAPKSDGFVCLSGLVAISWELSSIRDADKPFSWRSFSKIVEEEVSPRNLDLDGKLSNSDDRRRFDGLEKSWLVALSGDFWSEESVG